MGALWTDLYELKMAASYLRRGMAGPATFSLFVRHLPSTRGYLVAAGLADCLAFLDSFRFTADELAYLRDTQAFDEATLQAFASLRFSGDVWAVPEGHIVFADEPLIEVTAPIAEGQLLETYLLNQMTFQTTIASKAARCVVAAGGRDLVDFAFRRTQSPEAAMSVARVSAMIGFAGTSNVEAARRFGLRAVGTMAHSYIQAFPTERQAFRAFATDFPESTTFLVDTFETLDGVRSAIEVIRKLGLCTRLGIRLDSGDLGELARGSRRLLDDAGLTDARIVASGGLDEYEITRLLAEGAPIDTFGVGTKMGVSADAPYLDSVYKLVAYGDRPVMKLSPAKVTAPGAKQVFRRVDGPFDDMIGLRDEPTAPDREPLLVQVIRDGRRVTEGDDLHAANERFRRDLLRLPDSARRIERPAHPLARRSRRLDDLIARTHRGVAPEGSQMNSGRDGGP
jgi:nicotinate phosphoribosyltransferase